MTSQLPGTQNWSFFPGLPESVPIFGAPLTTDKFLRLYKSGSMGLEWENLLQLVKSEHE